MASFPRLQHKETQTDKFRGQQSCPRKTRIVIWNTSVKAQLDFFTQPRDSLKILGIAAKGHFFKRHRINHIQFRSAHQLHPSLGLFFAHPHYRFYHHQHYVINIVIKPLAGEGDNAGLCAHILTAFSFFLFLVTVPLSLCMCVKVPLDFNLKIFGGCSYGTLWGRENCSILRRRNKLIKSRTDHKRTAKWQPVWFGNLQLKVFFFSFLSFKFREAQYLFVGLA